MNKNSTIFVGLDLGDNFSYIVILNQDAEVIEETRLPTSKSALKRKFSTIPSCKIAMEVGAQSRWVSDLLRELGHDVIVANARKLRAIYANPRKDDRADAETLARLARLDPDLLSPIHHRSPQAQADLAVLRSRDALLRSRIAPKACRIWQPLVAYHILPSNLTSSSCRLPAPQITSPPKSHLLSQKRCNQP